MALLLTARWVLAHLLRSPFLWLWLGLLAALWPAIAVFTPLGLTTEQGTELGTLYEIAFLSLLVGQLSALSLLQRGAWFLEPLAPQRRVLLQATALSVGAALTLTASLGLAAALGAPLSSGLVRGALLAHFHAAALSLVLLRLPLHPGTRLAALPALVWLLPALAAGAGRLGALLAHGLDARRHLAFSHHTDPAEAHWSLAILPIVGLFVAALLLSRPHAIRHPR